MRATIEEAGYAYQPPPDVVPNSRRALMVTELARDAGLHEPVHARLMHAYWSEGANIGDDETLLALVEEAGLDRKDASAALADERYAERVATSTRRANMHGINAIPAFVLDWRLLIMGAQPHAVFEQALGELTKKED